MAQELQRLLDELLRATPHLNFILTSCNPGATLFSSIPHVELGPMGEQDAQDLLHEYCPQVAPAEAQEICKDICQLNPLAISIAGARLARGTISAQV